MLKHTHTHTTRERERRFFSKKNLDTSSFSIRSNIQKSKIESFGLNMSSILFWMNSKYATVKYSYKCVLSLHYLARSHFHRSMNKNHTTSKQSNECECNICCIHLNQNHRQMKKKLKRLKGTLGDWYNIVAITRCMLARIRCTSILFNANIFWSFRFSYVNGTFDRQNC